MNSISLTRQTASLSEDQTSYHREISERRQKAFKRAQTHSSMVFWLRRVFPALALISVGFYFIGGEFSFKYGDHKASVEKIELTKNELKMTNPRLEGHDKKAGSYVILADSAVQKASAPHVIHLDKVDGKLVHPQNGTLTLTANNGVFDSNAEVMDLSGDIIVKGSEGLKARLSTANILIKTQKITSNEPVFAEMNGSTIRAERVEFDGLSKTVLFQERVRVKLIKRPDEKVKAKAQ